jgi:hypothetical protein
MGGGAEELEATNTADDDSGTANEEREDKEDSSSESGRQSEIGSQDIPETPEHLWWEELQNTVAALADEDKTLSDFLKCF